MTYDLNSSVKVKERDSIMIKMKRSVSRRNSVNQLIEQLGGASSAARVLNISKSTLEKYQRSDGNFTIPDYMFQKIKPFLGRTDREILTLVAKRADETNRELRETTQDLRTSWRENSRLKKQIDLQRKMIEEISHDGCIPQLSWFYYIGRDLLEEFVNQLEEVKVGSEVNSFELYRAASNFELVYKMFRPNRVTNHSRYFGTVDLLDEALVTVALYLGIEPKIRVSLSAFARGVRPHKLERKEIDWNQLCSNIKSIAGSIEHEVQERSLEHVVKFRQESIPITRYLVVDLIERIIGKGFDVTFGEDGEFSIDGAVVYFSNKWDFFNALRKLMEEQGAT